MEKSITKFWMEKINQELRAKERKRIQQDIREYCNKIKEEFITYPEVLKIINKDSHKN